MKFIRLKYLIVILIFSGCNLSKDSKINFKVDNPATGIINESEWTVKSGIGIRTDVFGINDFTIHLVDTVVDNLCDRDYRKIRRVTIVMNELKLGKFTHDDLQLQDDLNGISFFDPTINTSFLGDGESAEEGVVEITEIDEKQRIIKGRIEAKLGEENYVKGNFRVKWCPKI